jgi:hypothetical protein
MTRRVIPMILSVAIALTGLVAAQDPDPGDPPVRLKKKNRDPEPGANRDQLKQPPQGLKEPGKEDGMKEPGKEDGMKEPGPEGAQAETPKAEDPKEILSRIDRNLKAVVDRLENNELNDATRQRQDDVLNDLESLIRQKENQQNSGGSSSNQSSKSDQKQNPDKPMNQANPMNQQGNPMNLGSPMNQQGNPMNQGKPMNQGSPMNQSGQGSPMNQSGQGSPMNQQGNPMNQQGSGQGQPMNQQGNPMNQGGSGTHPGLNHQGERGGPNDKVDPPNRETDDGTWGTLPEVLRSQMNAYQTRKNYSQRNRDLVDSYRRSLSSPGPDKGD